VPGRGHGDSYAATVRSRSRTGAEAPVAGPFNPAAHRILLLILLVLAGLVASACSESADGDTAGGGDQVDEPSDSGTSGDAPSDPGGTDAVSDVCQAGAERIVDRLLEFTDQLGDMAPNEFLAVDADLDGLSAFQNDVAQIISDTANQNSTLCDLNGLQQFVAAELSEVEAEDLITGYLVSTILFGGNLERADVTVAPDDDIAAVLALLDDGSSIMLEAGTYRLEAPLLIGREITMVGAGRSETILRSSAPDAAVAIFGGGSLRMRDLAVTHVGEQPASVVLAYGGSVDIGAVDIGGGTGDADRGGTGNGILLAAGVEPGADGAGAPGDDSEARAVQDSVIEDVLVFDNDIAGITVNDDLEPAIVDVDVRDNGLCGICFLGDAAGLVEGSQVTGNQFGVQAGDRSAPIVRDNTITDNEVVGVVLVGDSTALVEDNVVRDNGEAGIAIQESAVPRVRSNRIGDQPFGVTVVGSSVAVVDGNRIDGGDVGVQVGEDATPTLTANEIVDVEIAGIVVRDRSTPTIADHSVQGEQGVGLLVEGSASANVAGLSVDGGGVGASFGERATGRLGESVFIGQEIGVQVEEDARPVIEANRFEEPGAAAIVVRSSGVTTVVENTVVEPTTLGVGIAGTSEALVERNRITGGETAISLIEASAAVVVDNDLENQLVAIQVADDAAPLIDGNRITTPTGVGVVYRDASGGSFEGNTIVDPGTIGVQLVDRASPTVAGNTFVSGVLDAVDSDDTSAASSTPEPGEPTETPDPRPTVERAGEDAEVGDGDESADGSDEPTITVAVLASGTSSVIVEDNSMLGFVVGIQVEESAEPDLSDNDIDGGDARGVGILFRDDAGGAASRNVTRLHSIGIQVDDDATPALRDNRIEWASDVAVLVQGMSTPRVEGTFCPDGIAGIGVRAPAVADLGSNECAVVSADS